MSVVQMSKLAICAMKDSRKAILETLQSMGIMEIIRLDDLEGIRKMDTLQSRMTFERNAQLAVNAVEILNRYSPVKESLLASFKGKDVKTTADEQRMERERTRIMEIAFRIVGYEKKIAEDKAAIVKCENRMESLIPWKSMDVSLNGAETRLTKTIIGTMPETDIAAVSEMIAAACPQTDAYDIEIAGTDHNLTYLAIVCLNEDAAGIEAALRENGFVRPAIGGRETPLAEIDHCRQEIETYQTDIRGKIEQIRELKDVREDLKMISDYYRIRADKYEVLAELPQTENVFFLEGYVPEKYADKVTERLENDYGAFVEREPIGEDEDVPVVLHNGDFSSNVESILESFGLPKKGEMDPTFLTSIFFVFLFGLMLSDAAYGAIVSIVTAILILKCPNMEKEMKRLVQLFFWCGLSTIFWGIMFGGYFGDAIQIIAKNFFHTEVTVPALWFIPLDNPMKLLIWSMIFGIIHLFTGLGLKGYTAIKNHDVVSFIFDVLCWFMLLTGLILMLIPTSIFAGIAQQQITFPEWLNTTARILAIAGAAGILVMSARDKKNFGLRLALGAYDLYGISGWLSDVLSYSRLLALGLATGVIASVVNQMGSMIGGGVVGAIAFIIIFIIGHLLNLAINLLGAYVHTCRLQYVEFFGKFYEGGGKAFEPFNQKTKFVDFKEEK